MFIVLISQSQLLRTNLMLKKHSSKRNRALCFYRKRILPKKFKNFGKLSEVVKLCFHMGLMIAGVF